VKISKVGSIEAITELKPYGYQGFLMGKLHENRKCGKAATEFISKLNY
jgi:indole-3-glycerol phosphate synthase